MFETTDRYLSRSHYMSTVVDTEEKQKQNKTRPIEPANISKRAITLTFEKI